MPITPTCTASIRAPLLVRPLATVPLIVAPCCALPSARWICRFMDHCRLFHEQVLWGWNGRWPCCSGPALGRGGILRRTTARFFERWPHHHWHLLLYLVFVLENILDMSCDCFFFCWLWLCCVLLIFGNQLGRLIDDNFLKLSSDRCLRNRSCCWIHLVKLRPHRHCGRKRGQGGRHPRPYPLPSPSTHHRWIMDDWQIWIDLQNGLRDFRIDNWTPMESQILMSLGNQCEVVFLILRSVDDECENMSKDWLVQIQSRQCTRSSVVASKSES